MKKNALLIVATACAGIVVSTWAADPAPTARPAASACSACPIMGGQKAKPQTQCPIMGGKVDKQYFVDTDEGCRIYVCCADCIDKVKADPKKAIAKIKANGETVECPALNKAQGTNAAACGAKKSCCP